METIKLKNGAEEAKPAVMATMVALRHLWEQKPILAVNLVLLCRDPEHEPWAGLEDLKRTTLVQSDGRVHATIRNVVLSAVRDDGLFMEIGDPALT